MGPKGPRTEDMQEPNGQRHVDSMQKHRHVHRHIKAQFSRKKEFFLTTKEARKGPWAAGKPLPGCLPAGTTTAAAHEADVTLAEKDTGTSVAGADTVASGAGAREPQALSCVPFVT